MNRREPQITNEIGRILEIVCELTELPSRWSGKVELVPDADFKGKKPFTCTIQINAALAETPERWSTLIHESLHCVSAGYNRADYLRFPGWEEGVVEQLQRLYRLRILARLFAGGDAAIFESKDAQHYYNPYIDALESLRLALSDDPRSNDQEKFYTDLLGIPIRARSGYVLAKGFPPTTLASADFVKIFSIANSILNWRQP